MLSLSRPILLRWAAMCGVLLLLLAVNADINYLRAPIVGKYPETGDPLWRMNLTQSLAISRNWLETGFAKNGFRMNFSNPVVESPDPSSPYVSYPPAFALFPYVLAKLTGTSLDIEHFSAWGALCHFVCAALVALIAFLFAERWGGSFFSAAPLAALAGSTVLLVPSSLIFFPFAWWADIIVLPFFFALIATESFMQKSSALRRPLLITLLALGVLTDWLFFLLIFCVMIKDLTSKPRQFRPELFVIPGLYLIWHTFIVWSSGMFEQLLNNFLQRSGVIDQRIALAQGLEYWWASLLHGLGYTGAILTLALYFVTPVLCIFFFFRHRFSPHLAHWLEASFLLCAPVLLHFLLLHQHYYEHPYENLKVAVLIPLFWLAMAPVLLMPLASAPLIRAAFVLLVCAAGWGIAHKYPEYNAIAFAVAPNVSPEFLKRCQEIKQNSSFNHISFSPHFGTAGPLPFEPPTPHPKVSPWAFEVCRRHIYFAEQPSEVKKYFDTQGWKDTTNDAPFRFQLWTEDLPSAAWKKFLVPGSGRKTGELWVHELSKEILR